jgi:Flp pilus assembly pilin Flp
LERRGEEIMRNLRSFMREEDGMGTVEVVLIIVVLVALVAIFKESIKSLVEKILKKVTDNANKI